MREVVLEEGVHPAVESLHDGEIGALAADVQDEVEEDERNAQCFIPVPLKRGQVQLEGLSVDGEVRLRDGFLLGRGLDDHWLLAFDDLLLEDHVLLLHRQRQ